MADETLITIDFGTGYDSTGVMVTDKGTVTSLDKVISDSTGFNQEHVSTSSGNSWKYDRHEYQPPLTTPPSPVANFVYGVNNTLQVTFNNLSLNAIKFEWNFGDGTSSGTRSPIHFYNTVGVYFVTLTAFNSAGKTTTFTSKITLAEPVAPVVPSVDFTYAIGGSTVFFQDASVITEENIPEWSFGDGTTSTEVNPSHEYQANGTYQVILRRGELSETKSITIASQIVLVCDDTAGVTGYKWEVSSNGVDGWTEIADTPLRAVGISEELHGVDSTELNYFRVIAYNGAGDSLNPSSVASVRCG